MDNETAYIAYFDVVLWISDQLVGFEETDHRDTWDEAERQIRRLCELGDLVAYGLPTQDAPDGLKPIPSTNWPRLWFSMMDGQPDDDLDCHGGRGYGKACWQDQRDKVRLTDAWDGVCFLKRDVLQHWPERASALGDIGSSSSPDRSAPAASVHSAAEMDAGSVRGSRAAPSLESALEAIAALHPEGIPSTIRAKRRNDAINKWLIDNRQDPVSPNTIVRAMKRL